MQIIDVSKYQGTIDFAKVKDSGIGGVIIRAMSTNSSGLYIDPYFEKNYKNAKANGLAVGAYYYSYALDKTYADKELAMFKSCLNGKSFELPIAVDIEDGTQKKLGKNTLAELVKYALDTMESWGAYSMWYSYKSFIDNYINTAMLSNYDFWLAWYTTTEPANYTYGIWQYSSQARVDGIGGNVDINKAYKDYPSIIVGKFNNFTNGVIEPIEKSDATYDDTDAIQFLSTEPVKMCIGRASGGDITTIANIITGLSIGCEINDGFIYTDYVSVGDQKTIIAKCNSLGVAYKEYVAVTVIAETTRELTEENDIPTDVEPIQETKKGLLTAIIEFILSLFK